MLLLVVLLFTGAHAPKTTGRSTTVRQHHHTSGEGMYFLGEKEEVEERESQRTSNNRQGLTTHGERVMQPCMVIFFTGH